MLPGITPENVGTVKPRDLLAAADVFAAKYLNDA